MQKITPSCHIVRRTHSLRFPIRRLPGSLQAPYTPMRNTTSVGQSYSTSFQLLNTRPVIHRELRIHNGKPRRFFFHFFIELKQFIHKQNTIFSSYYTNAHRGIAPGRTLCILQGAAVLKTISIGFLLLFIFIFFGRESLCRLSLRSRTQSGYLTNVF